MDSVHATSDDAAAARFTSRLAHSATPVVRTPGRALRADGPGRLAGRIGDFGIRLGLSHTSRWALDAQRDAAIGSTRTAPVRPPLSYWPWHDPDDLSELVEPVDFCRAATGLIAAGSSTAAGSTSSDRSSGSCHGQ